MSSRRPPMLSLTSPRLTRITLLLSLSALRAPGAGAQDDLVGEEWGSLFHTSVPFETQVTTLGLPEGLPSLGITSLAAAPDGLLWVATAGGVATFDGVRFRAVGPARDTVTTGRESGGAAAIPGGEPLAGPKDLEIERASALVTDLSGSIWVGAEDGTVVRYRHERAEPEPIDLDLGFVTTLAALRDGSVWVGGDGLYRVAGGRAECILSPGVQLGLRIVTVTEPPRDAREGNPEGGETFIAGSHGLMRWTASEGLSRLNTTPFNGVFFGPLGKRWDIVHPGAIFVDGEPKGAFGAGPGEMRGHPIGLRDSTVVGFERGVLSISNATGAIEHKRRHSFGSIKMLLAAPDGAVWVAQEPFGLHHVEPRSYGVVPVPLPGNYVTRVLSYGPDKALVASDSLGPPSTVSLLEDGVPRLSVADFRWTPPEGRRSIESTAESSNGEIYLSSPQGLYVSRGGTLSPVSDVPRPSWECVADPSGSVWVDQGDQLAEVRGGVWTGVRWPLPGGPRTALAWRNARVVGIEGHRIFELDPATGETVTLLEVPAAAGRDLHVDADGTLWITTYGQGLWRIGAQGEVDRWGLEAGLPDRFLAWIGEVPGPTAKTHLWCNSNRGSFAISRESLDAFLAGSVETVRCHVLHTPEANGRTGSVLGEGHLILPTMLGPVAVDTRQPLTDPAPPELTLDYVLADGKRLGDGEAVHGLTDLDFYYQSVFFPDGREAHVQVCLDGHDDAWVPAGGERFVRYTNLGPGEYVLRMRARAPGGAFGEELRAPAVIIRPHWYQLPLLRGAGLASLLVAGFVLARFRTRGLRRRSAALQQEVYRRENAEAVLQEQRAQFEQVLETAHEGIFSFAGDGTILYANPAAEKTFQLAPGDILVGRNVLELGIGRLCTEADLQALFKPDGEVRWDSEETTARRASGEPFDLDASLAPDASSGELHYVAIVRDTSDRRVMMDELRRSKERFRSLFQAAPTPILAWSAERAIIEWNDHAAQFFGQAKSRSAPADLAHFAADEAASGRIEESVRKILAGTKEVSFSMDTRVADGETRPCFWLLAPLVQVGGEVKAFISIVLDKSEEVRAEADLQRLRRQLSRAEETERARIARELHDDFSQRIAALAITVNLATSKLGDSNRSPQAKKPVAELQVVQQELRTLATDVHGLSRRLHPTVLEDLGLAAALRSECSRRAGLTGAKIELRCEGSLDDIQGEIGLTLFRVAQEAIQNAVSHGRPESISVSIEVKPGEIELLVVDDGIGFHPGATPGPGIGLASMRERVQLVGGNLVVASAPGEGTQLSVSVPLA